MILVRTACVPPCVPRFIDGQDLAYRVRTAPDLRCVPLRTVAYFLAYSIWSSAYHLSPPYKGGGVRNPGSPCVPLAYLIV